MILLVGCATSSIEDEDRTGAVRFKYPEPVVPVASESIAERDRAAQNRTIEIGRTLSRRMQNYDPN